MYLKDLCLIQFKNYEEAQLSFSSNINCFVGNNGSGKTNLLDAIYYMCFCKSYFNSIDTQNINFEKQFFTIEGTFDRKDQVDIVFCGVKRGQKKVFKRNKKEYEKLADHIGLFPLVIISPADRNLIIEGSETRRKFMDSVISQSDKIYLQYIIKYNQVVSQRNALLKYFAANFTYDPITLAVYNEQLIDLGTLIHAKRTDFMHKFNPIFQKYYKSISGEKEKVSLEYKSQLHDESLDALERFIALYPGSEKISYAYYLRALNYFEQIKDVERDQSMTNKSKQSFYELISKYPESDFIDDAHVKIDIINDRLAAKEIEIARYYQFNHQWISAINRYNKILENFDAHL